MIEAITAEIKMRKAEFRADTVATIYFGGGTPSVLSTKEIDAIINTVYKYYKVVPNPEITLEANPDDLVEEKIKEIANSPVNRLSIGIQSFFEKDLKLMNRAHNSHQAKESLAQAIRLFENISVDLIYGIPNTTHEEWRQNIKTALSFGVSHISSYALTVEPKTALENFIKKGIIDDVDDEHAQAQFLILIEELEKANFVHYELSNFGKEGFFSQNNTAYWQGKKYIGIGPSAHSYNGKARSWNVSNNAKYIRGIQAEKLPSSSEVLSKADRYNEYIMTGLRTIWGVSFENIKTNFGDRYALYLKAQAKKYVAEELLYIENETLKATRKGKFLVDGIAAALFILN